MIDIELVNKLFQVKEAKNYTLHDLSKRLDVQISTIERWLKTGHINRIYARLVREKLDID